MSTNNIKISLTNIEKILFVFCKNKKYFLMKSDQTQQKYYKLPSFVDFTKSNNFFNFSLSENTTFYLDSYINILNIWLKSCSKIIKKKSILKGLGFRCFLSPDKQKIHFKIGYSHIVILDVPKKIFLINIEKNFLVLEGSDQVTVGNFAKRIKQLRTFDIYKNKGFSYKNEILPLKQIKKS